MPAATRDLGFADLVTDVAQWATGVTGRPTVIGSAARSGEPGDESIVVHPLTIQPSINTPPHDAVEATARVLIFAATDDVAAAHAVTTLALTALAESARDIDLTPASDQTWIALGVTPRPSFSIAGPVRQHVDRAAIATVRHPLNLRATKLRVLSGDLRSTDGTALSPGRVRLEPHGPATHVGHDGRWSLPVPALEAATLDITAKGARLQRNVAPEDVELHIVVDLDLDAAPTAVPTTPAPDGKD